MTDIVGGITDAEASAIAREIADCEVKPSRAVDEERFPGGYQAWEEKRKQHEADPPDQRVSEIKQRAHYFADRQEITLELYRDICWLAERCSWFITSYEWEREALEKIAYQTWPRDMGSGKIAAAMHAIAAKALADTRNEEGQ